VRGGLEGARSAECAGRIEGGWEAVRASALWVPIELQFANLRASGACLEARAARSRAAWRHSNALVSCCPRQGGRPAGRGRQGGQLEAQAACPGGSHHARVIAHKTM